MAIDRGLKWRTEANRQVVTHQPFSPITWRNSKVSSWSWIIRLINTIRNITRPYCSSTLSFSSFPSRSSLPCFSLPPVISVAPAPVSLPVPLTPRPPCLARRQRTVSARHFATRGLGPARGGHQGDGQGGVLQGIAAVKTHRLTFPSRVVFCGRQKKSPPSIHQPFLPHLYGSCPKGE